MPEPEFDSFEEEVAYYESRQKTRRHTATAALEQSPAVIAVYAPTKYTGERKELYIVTRDTYPSPGGPFRVSEFMIDGPWGHHNVADVAAAAKELADKSWAELYPATDAEVIAWTSTAAFQRGVYVAAFIQAGNALRYRAKGDEARQRATEVERLANELFEKDPEGAVAMMELELRKNPDSSALDTVAKIRAAATTTRKDAMPDHDDLHDNPAWVTGVLARSFEDLEDKVRPELLPRLSDVSARRGALVAKMKEYGCGAYGCVLPTQDPSIVLKITTDPTEAEFAGQIANTLVAPIAVHYYTVVRLSERYRKMPVYLLWRDGADKVGKMPARMADKVDDQHRLGQVAFDQVFHKASKAVQRKALARWIASWEAMADGTIAELVPLARGIVKVYREQKILFGDLHSGNFGVVDGAWKITDPGHIAVLDSP
jgi:hypothetical protein